MENKIANWFFNVYLNEIEYKSIQGYKRILTNIAFQRNEKVIDKAINYLVNNGEDKQILQFMRPSISKLIARLADEEYDSILTGE